MSNREYIEKEGSAFTLARFQCDQFRCLKKIEFAEKTIQAIRFGMQDNENFTSAQDTEMEVMFSSRLSVLDARKKELESSINECYRLNVPGTWPGSQDDLDHLGYSEFSLESSQEDLRRSELVD